MGHSTWWRVLFNLVEPWLGTRRIHVGDSAFASVKLAERLEEFKTGMIGSIKQATSLFPIKRLSMVEADGQRGGMCKTRLARCGVLVAILTFLTCICRFPCSRSQE